LITVRRDVDPGKATRGAWASDFDATACKVGFKFREVNTRGLTAVAEGAGEEDVEVEVAVEAVFEGAGATALPSPSVVVI
jgi:hypothetical protein